MNEELYSQYLAGTVNESDLINEISDQNKQRLKTAGKITGGAALAGAGAYGAYKLHQGKKISKLIDKHMARHDDTAIKTLASIRSDRAAVHPPIKSTEDLFNAAGYGHPEALKHPALAKVRDESGNTPLHIAASEGHPEALKHPALAKVKNDRGYTPLHIAARKGHPEVFKHPDFAKVKNEYGETPRDLAIKKGHIK